MPKRRLILMRHAKSDWSDGQLLDFERPLAARGKKAAKHMGKWLKHQHYHVDRIICSPALRTKQTAQCVANQLGLPHDDMTMDDSLYEASLDALLAMLEKNHHPAQTLLLIAHNPGLDQLLCYLCREIPPTNHSGKLMTTAAIAVLSYDDNCSDIFAPRQARLECLVRPRELNQQSDLLIGKSQFT